MHKLYEEKNHNKKSQVGFDLFWCSFTEETKCRFLFLFFAFIYVARIVKSIIWIYVNGYLLNNTFTKVYFINNLFKFLF